MLWVSGTKVQFLLADRRMSQSVLAHSAGIDKNTVSSIISAGEKGSARTPETAGKLATVLGVDLEEILVAQDKPSVIFSLTGVPSESLGRVIQALTTPLSTYPPPFDHKDTRDAIISRFTDEALLVFKRTDIFDLRNLIRSFEADEKSPLPANIGTQVLSLIETTSKSDPRLTPSAKSRSNQRGPLKVRLMASLFGTVLLFQHLRLIQKIELKLEYTNSLFSGPELRAAMRSDDIGDLVALPLIATSRLFNSFNRLNYNLAMVMPRGTHRILVPPGGDQNLSTKGASFVTLGDVGGTAELYLKELNRLGVLPLHDSSQIATDVRRFDDIMKRATERYRAVLMFPFSAVYEVTTGATMIDNENLEVASKESYLFASQKFRARVTEFEHTMHRIRVAYHACISNPDLLRALVVSLFNDREFVDALAEGLGSYRFEKQNRKKEKQ